MAATFKVTVFNARIVSIIQTGDGNRWIRDKAKSIENRARAIAPRRTGTLASSHVTLPTSGTNQYQKRYRVSAQAPYALFVHEGTGIYGPRHTPVVTGGWMKLPGRNPNPNRVGRTTVIRSHRGQRANNWLERAAREVL